MTVNIRIVAASSENALLVPEIAVSRKDGRHLVYRLQHEGARPEPVEVQSGIRDGINIEIVEGLKEGDLVVASAAVFEDQEKERRMPRMRSPRILRPRHSSGGRRR